LENYMMSSPLNILVLCTGNSARSILGEAVLQRFGAGRIQAFSAGSQPKTSPNPFALKLLGQEGYDTSDFNSKSWAVFSTPDAPRIDVVITVCDAASGESCPIFMGAPIRVHWGLEDPAEINGSDATKEAAFQRTYNELCARADALRALPFETMTASDFHTALKAIARLDGATQLALSGSHST
jgi:protein-tyrosine-phosphatase